MSKSPDAFRTISEVADWLDVPTHVLRFWESRFSQVKPVKRAGGRRYYRPNDMRLLGGIKRLLHDDGMTIRGVQKLLREEGVKHIASFSKPLDSQIVIDVTPVKSPDESPMAVDVEPEPLDNVVPLAEAPVQEEPKSEELVFLHRPSGDEGTAPPPTAPATEEPDLFTSSRATTQDTPSAAEDVAATPAIPSTPEVPDTDPDDDDARYIGRVSVASALRPLLANSGTVDPAILADVQQRLEAARARL